MLGGQIERVMSASGPTQNAVTARPPLSFFGHAGLGIATGAAAMLAFVLVAFALDGPDSDLAKRISAVASLAVALLAIVHSIKRSTGLTGRVVALIALGAGAFVGYAVAALFFMSFMTTPAH
jgi:hypothetical protein